MEFSKEWEKNAKAFDFDEPILTLSFPGKERPLSDFNLSRTEKEAKEEIDYSSPSSQLRNN